MDLTLHVACNVLKQMENHNHIVLFDDPSNGEWVCVHDICWFLDEKSIRIDAEEA